MTNEFAGKTILVTGGSGSFGKTVVAKMLENGAAEVRVVSRDEAKHDAMRHSFKNDRLKLYVGDVRDRDSINRPMRDVDFVFHAAALKQVPSGEFFPMEAIKTNVLGSKNVLDAAEEAQVKSVVCLSTDKAVYPINAMGMSKALMEKLARSFGLNARDAETTVSCVRYGNVMYSRGSVIPLFISQIKAGKEITVTNPEMTRFMMSLAQSVDLVEFALTNARQGDLFIRKAPACTVEVLAEALMSLFEVTLPLTVIGTRHAEKVSEALATQEELARAQDMGNYFRVTADNRELNYGAYFEEGDIFQTEYSDYDSHTVPRMTQSEVEALLLTLPEVREELVLAGLSHKIS